MGTPHIQQEDNEGRGVKTADFKQIREVLPILPSYVRLLIL